MRSLTQILRFWPATTLATNNLRSLVWAEDAISFAHCNKNTVYRPGTAEGSINELIVSDNQISTAVDVIIHHHPYYKLLPKGHGPWWDPSPYPNSSCLALSPSFSQYRTFRSDPDELYHWPRFIYIHPQSFWNLNIDDLSKSSPYHHKTPLLRFPTISTMFDFIIDSNFEHYEFKRSGRERDLRWTQYEYGGLEYRIGFWRWDLLNRSTVMGRWNERRLGEEVIGADGKVNPWAKGGDKEYDGEIRPREFKVLHALRPENRPHFERLARFGKPDITDDHWRQRNEILHGSR